MAIYSIDGHRPNIAPDAFVVDNATVIGRVTLGPGASVWFNAVLRGDGDDIVIGAGSNVQDGAVLHVDPGFPLKIGERVSIGHQAMLHGCTVGDGSLIGIGATLLAGSRIGRNCLVAAGAVVPPNLVVKDGMCVMGLPGRVVRETTAREKAYLAMVPDRYLRLAKLHHEHPDDPRVRPFA